MPTFVRLKQPLGPTYPSDEEDTLLTKHLLTDVGHFEIPGYGITPWPDDPLFNGIDSFQRRKSLDVDRLMLPGGPTEKALNEELTRLNLPLRQDRDCDQERVEPAIRLPGGIWRRDNCPAPTDDECDRQFEDDIRRCAQIAGGDRRLYRNLSRLGDGTTCGLHSKPAAATTLRRMNVPATKYELHAFARGADGSLRPFDLFISEAEHHPEFGWQCSVECAAIRGKPMRMFGDTPDFAWLMAIKLVKRLIEYAEWSLVDSKGVAITLPDVPDIHEIP